MDSHGCCASITGAVAAWSKSPLARAPVEAVVALARVGAAPFARTWPMLRPDATFRPALPDWRCGARGAPHLRLSVSRKSGGKGEMLGASRHRHGSTAGPHRRHRWQPRLNPRGIPTFGLPCPRHLSNECGAENIP